MLGVSLLVVAHLSCASLFSRLFLHVPRSSSSANRFPARVVIRSCGAHVQHRAAPTPKVSSWISTPGDGRRLRFGVVCVVTLRQPPQATGDQAWDECSSRGDDRRSDAGPRRSRCSRCRGQACGRRARRPTDAGGTALQVPAQVRVGDDRRFTASGPVRLTVHRSQPVLPSAASTRCLVRRRQEERLGQGPDSGHDRSCPGVLPPFEIDRARRPAPGTRRAGERTCCPPRELNSLPRAAGTGRTDSRLPRCRFTNDRRPRLLTFPSIVRPPLSRSTVFSLFPPSWSCPAVRRPVPQWRRFGSIGTCRAGEQHAAPREFNSLPARSGQRNRQPAASVPLHQRPPTAALDPSVHRPSSSLPFYRLLVIFSFVVLSGRAAAGTSVTPVRFDRHLSGTRTTCCPTAAQLAACAQRAAEPTAGCLGAASPTTADRGS